MSPIDRRRIAIAAAALALLGAIPAPGSGQDAPPAAVKEAAHAFHDALVAGDSARALELLHPELRVFEDGHAETLSEYRSGHLSADMEFSAVVGRELLEERVFRSGDRAFYLSEYRVDGTFRGEDIELHGTETMVLLRTPDGWRIRHIHWSSR